MIYFTIYFTIFCIFYPQTYLGYFVQGQFDLPTTFVKERHKRKVQLDFESFQIVADRFLGCQFLEKYRVFYFGQFLMH